MREVISIHVGNCGNGIAYNYWKQLASEHRVTADGVYTGDNDVHLAGIASHFHDCDGRRYVPRCVNVDLEASSLDHLSASDIGSLFRPDNFVSGTKSAGNNWAKGHYTQGTEIIESIMDQIRKEAGNSDRLQGFCFTHSLQGGTGSGLGTFIMSKVREEFPDKMLEAFTVFPSPETSHNLLEPYNATLSVHQLVENADMVHLLDNEALIRHQYRTHPNTQKTFSSLNQIIALAMCDSSCGFRYPGRLNCDLRKLAVNLIPFPRLHFFIPSIASTTQSPNAVRELTSTIFSPKNTLCSIDTFHGQSFTCAAFFRGLLSSGEIESTLFYHTQKNSSHFTEWIPGNIQVTMCDTPSPNRELSALLFNNSKSQQHIYKRIAEQFTAMFRRKAFLHWYTSEGMDEMEFTEAESNMNDLISEFQFYGEGCHCCEEDEHVHDEE